MSFSGMKDTEIEPFAKQYRRAGPEFDGVRNALSGWGSSLSMTESIRKDLPVLLKQYGVRTMLDAPCGDCNWIQHIEFPLQQYIGMDIVPEVIAQNTKLHGSNNRQFIVGDITRNKMPRVDFILCRDCLIHLPLEYGVETVQRFVESGSTYLAMSTYPHTDTNLDVIDESVGSLGGFHQVNMQLPPFNFPPSLAMIDEGGYDRHVGVWNITSLAKGRGRV